MCVPECRTWSKPYVVCWQGSLVQRSFRGLPVAIAGNPTTMDPAGLRLQRGERCTVKSPEWSQEMLLR